ncbi:MAG: methyltransferase domain-containing protein [Thermoplasmata archaeon]|uniref:Methyltransferase domain-containing protein n=1 Tax=Candidatus Sysuiplasma superficiale TaxID=2823368 RepID=A0A8J7YN43_9ARCH|nr:methyltransferase domain-containing protein [Candidatus Sysuiplasma superficiale]MBX8644355.1 methyltransferase domain-containing protein [Candidatus Sysuiplasma superficiale]MCL4346393.1 hypothetical protein [Candidatus Thermoplasmatota archaeon]MCL5437116.1 hypothetical protein [Candidatus Thermoplasmatota archaeon]
MHVMLMDEEGKKYYIHGKGMVKIRGLGVVDADRIRTTPYGESIRIAGKRFIVVRPTAEEIISSITRGPQVITSKDAAIIVHYLGIGNGSAVIEGGAGSGCLSLFLLQSVFPDGAVISVDNRSDHLRIAAENVSNSDFSACWHPVKGDIRHIQLSHPADAMVLDIPDPWDALDTASSCLKAGAILAVYLPTINQTEKTVVISQGTSLRHETSFELLMRKLEVKDGGTRHSYETLGHTGYISIFRKMS